MARLHDLTALATVLSLALYLWMAIRTGRMRRLYGIEAPATTGDPIFERAFRVQMNTLEWLPLYLAALWLFALYWPDRLAAFIAAFWIVGRLIYAILYVQDPSKRGLGFAIQALATLVLLAGAGVGAVHALMLTGE